MSLITSTIYPSIEQIDRGIWDRLVGDIPEGYDFFRTIEASRLEGMSFAYIMLMHNGVPALLAPVFTGDLDLGIALDGAARKAVTAIRRAFPRLLIMKTLFIGSPFGENGVIGLGRGAADTALLMAGLNDAITALCRSRRLPCALFKDLLDKDVPLVEPLVRQGFFRAESFPGVAIDLNYASMEDYLLSLGAETRKDMRRKLRKAQAQTAIEVRVTDNAAAIIDEVYALYLNTYNAGTVRFEKLTPEFFLNAGKNMAGTTFFLYYIDGHLAAFNLCLRHKDTLIDKFIGFDYTLARRHNLYFFSWLYNIEWCLKNSVRCYQVGQTDYEAKLRLGGALIPLNVFLRHNNGIMNSILRAASACLTPAHNDQDLKTHG